jgi:hypothetical protein
VTFSAPIVDAGTVTGGVARCFKKMLASHSLKVDCGAAVAAMRSCITPPIRKRNCNASGRRVVPVRLPGEMMRPGRQVERSAAGPLRCFLRRDSASALTAFNV